MQYSPVRLICALLVGLGLLGLNGCSNTLGTPFTLPSITSFSASPTAIAAGTSSSLTGVFSNGDGVITPGNISVTSGTAVSITPASTTTYTLTVSKSGGYSATQTATITVTPNPPTITSFVASQPSIIAGGSTNLTAVFGNGTGVITPGNLTVVSGTPVVVTPSDTTTYTLTVTNAAGVTVNQTVVVTVAAAAPAISSFTANPTAVTSGGTANLTAVFSGGVGVITPGNLPVTSGTPVPVTPADTTTYTLTVTNAAGASVNQAAVVTVTAAAPSVTSFAANPTAIAPGATSALTAVFTNGVGVVTPGNLPITSGTPVSVSPTITTTYTVTVTNPGGFTAAQTAKVTVTPNAPTITSLVANPTTVVAGASTSLTPTFSNGTGVITPGNIAVTSGSAVTVTPADTTTYTLTVTNAAGATASQAVLVTVTPVAPSITSFSASPAALAVSGPTTLTPIFANGTGIITPGNLPAVSGTPVSVSPSNTTTYTLTVTNAAGVTAVQTAVVTISPGPSITSFAPADASITAGASTTLTGVFTNGLGVIMPGNIIVSTGTPVTVSPTTTTTYTLTVTNSAHVAVTETAIVTVTPAAPTITSFAAAAPTIAAGGNTTLTGVFANGTGIITPGNLAVTSGTAVTVTPSNTTTYTLTVTNSAGVTATKTAIIAVNSGPSITGFSAAPTSIAAGSSTSLTGIFTGGTGVIMPGNIAATSGTAVSVSPTTTTTYILTVTGTGTNHVSQSAIVTVTPVAPTITSFLAASPTITAGGNTTLTGVFANGAGVITPGNIAATSGTAVTVTPSDTTTYTLTVTNSAGVTATQTAIITVNPVAPSITSFTATPTSITAGGNTNLSAVFTGGTGVITPGSIAITSGSVANVSPTTTTTYTLTVTPASGPAVTKSLTVSVTAAGVLTAPMGLTATPGNSLATLNWSAVSGATSYTVLRSTTSGGPYSEIGTSIGTEFGDVTVVNNTTYYYVVEATNAVGPSANSNEASATPVAPPLVATNLVAVPGDGQIVLTWTTGTGATSFQVARSLVSGGPYTTVGTPTAATYTDTGLTDGTAYYYVVYSVNAVATSAASNQAFAIPIAAISGLTALPSDGQVALAWNTSAGATSYNVDLYSGSVCAGTPIVVSTNTARYLDTGLTDGIAYSFTVTAVNSTGTSAASACVSATPEAGTLATMLNTPNVGLGTWGMSDYDSANAFVDVAMQARTWQQSNWNAGSATIDANGWPTEDASTVLQTFLIGGQTTPFADFVGTYKLVFTGKATVSGQWFTGTVKNYAYDATTNTSTADVNVTGQGAGYINLVLTNTQRTATSATNTGFTNLHLYRPGYPTDGSAVFTTPFLNALSQVNTIRMMDWTDTNGNYVVNWANRTTPHTATQQGFPNSWTGPDGTVFNGSGGAALEYQIMLCNTIKADCYINIPVVANDDFITKMAETIAFGSDGTNPYTAPQANPVYPPLNPQLRVYLEYANEVWNSNAGVWGVVDDICANLSTTDPTNPLLTIDTVDKNGGSTIGIYQQIFRYPAWRMATISQIFQGVFGANQMMTRVRPVLETQQGDGNGTLDIALQFLDAYAPTLTPATTIPKLIWGGGGSAYYGVINSNSSTPDSIFAAGNYPDPNTLNAWAYDSMWLTNYGLKHIAYEGGPGISSGFTDAQNVAINKDPRMETMMNAYKTAWDNMGGDLLIYYDLAGSTPWEFTSNIFPDGPGSGIETPKFYSLKDSQAPNARAPITLGTTMPGTVLAVNQTTKKDNLNLHNDYGYDNTIGKGTKMCTVVNAAGAFIAYPVNATSAFTGSLTITGVGNPGNVNSSTLAATMKVWINGVDEGSITLPATTNDTEVTSSTLSVNIPAGLSVVRMVDTTGGFTVCSLTIQ